MKMIVIVGVLVLLTGCQTGPTKSRSVVIMPPDGGDRLWFFHETPSDIGTGGELQIFVDPEHYPAAKASFAKYTMGVGAALQMHRHEKTEEFAYILSGEGAAVTLDDDREIEIPIAAGYFWYNPPGVWHAVKNVGDTPLTMVFATVPNEQKGLLSFFRKIGVAPGHPGKAIAPEELERLAAEHDMIFWVPTNDDH